MSRPPRLLFPHTVTLLTTRVQQGLPFVHTPLMEMILWSALAVAQDSYRIKGSPVRGYFSTNFPRLIL